MLEPLLPVDFCHKHGGGSTRYIYEGCGGSLFADVIEKHSRLKSFGKFISSCPVRALNRTKWRVVDT